MANEKWDMRYVVGILPESRQSQELLSYLVSEKKDKNYKEPVL